MVVVTATKRSNLQLLIGEDIEKVAPIYSLKKHGNTLYVGGFFNGVGYQSGSAALLPNGGIKPDFDFPHCEGDILVTLPDGNGGWFLGGEIDKVEETDVFGLVHILPNKKLDTTFLPDINNDVFALALVNDTLFVGGWFTQIDGQPQNYLAALGLNTKTKLPWSLEQEGQVTE